MKLIENDVVKWVGNWILFVLHLVGFGLCLIQIICGLSSTIVQFVEK